MKSMIDCCDTSMEINEAGLTTPTNNDFCSYSELKLTTRRTGPYGAVRGRTGPYGAQGISRLRSSITSERTARAPIIPNYDHWSVTGRLMSRMWCATGCGAPQDVVGCTCCRSSS